MTSENYARRLIQSVQELSLARHLDAIAPVVRHAARELVGGLGRHQPLVEGQRFALQACISGWSMLNRQAAVIEDIYLDPRIPHAAYWPTFVKSLVMVPIRAPEPIGAIGAYWARQHRASATEVEMLQALADSTSVALENIQVYAELERRVEERTAQLAEASQRLHVEIAERERAEQAVRQLFLIDELTARYNRRGFLLLAERELQAAWRRQGRSLLLYADLDYLKRANDSLGHDGGDRMLVDAAQGLKGVFRSGDVVARWAATSL